MIADRWGVTGAEVAAPYPCDKHVKAPTMQAWRGITIHAGVVAAKQLRTFKHLAESG